MNEKLSDWGSIAEIISGIAVVITLIVLIMGVRENTEVVRAASFADLLESLNSFQIAQMTNEETVRVWDAFVYGDASNLDRLDNTRLDLAILNLFRIYDSAYYSAQRGLVGDAEWTRFERNFCDNFRRVGSAGKMDVLESVVTPDFFLYLRRLCSE